jgi:predicted AlkP superfamily pyrophosphatase or phosphodiesterase
MKLAQRILLLFLFLLLPACQIQNLPGQVTQTPRPASTLTATDTYTATFTATATETLTPTFTPTPAPQVRRVLILSIDGLRPDAISLAPMPNLQTLMLSSAYTLTAQTVYPSVTLISHTSMLTGLCPSKHGVDWNDYIPENGVAAGTDLFDLAHAAGLETWMFVGKTKLKQITDSTSLTGFVKGSDRDSELTDQLLSEFPEDFGVLFVHFATTDGMGHEYGWLSQEQLSVLRRADESIGRILTELNARNLRKETLVIITADHGGHETTHGSSMPEDMTIPWIASGPGIKPGELTTTVHTMDTAASAAFALGIEIPPEWDGVPVYEAFGLPAEKTSLQCGESAQTPVTSP